MEWQIPVTIIERGAMVYVTANNKTEAILKMRRREWSDKSDPDDAAYIVMKVGPCEKVKL